MISDEPAVEASPEAPVDKSPNRDFPSWEINEAHEDKTTEALRADPVFFEKLRGEFPPFFKSQQVPATEAAMVKFFARRDMEQVQNLFWLVRRALWVTDTDARDTAARRRQEEAAAYLYCLAACRLVNQAEHQARISQHGVDRHIVFVPTDENVVCAIIATALFGGELRLMPSEKEGLPQAEYLFEVKAPEGTDQIASDFEVAAYVAFFYNDAEVADLSVDRGSGVTLTPQQRKRLLDRVTRSQMKDNLQTWIGEI